MTAPRPFCSIVVPTRDRPDALRTCLESLARLDYPRDRLEVIVVDDGGETDLEAVVAPLRPGLNVVLLRQAWAGPAAARNLGVEQARGELLAFTDDDCAPRPDWLARLAARYLAHPDSAAGGLTINALRANPYASAAQMIIDAGYAQRNHDTSPVPFFTTNNLAVPRDDFRLAGGFDASFLTAEDREFCARWAGQGRRIGYEPDAVVEHRHPLTFRKFCRLFFAYGRGASRFHREQARRGRPVSLEASFYFRTLPRYALAGRPLREGVLLLALLVPWHLANTVGFIYEWVRNGRQAQPRATAPEQEPSGLLDYPRVLQLLWSGGIGGIERQVAAVARYGSAHGDGEYRACFLDGRGIVGESLVAEGLAYRLDLRAGWDVIGLWQLWRLLRRRRPDVVHSHTHALLPTLVARLALPHAAFVYTEQSPRVLTSDGKFRVLYRLLSLSVSRFIALTPSMALAMENYGIDRSRTVIIPNMFAISRRASPPQRQRPQTIGIVARLEPQKRVDLLIEVIGELRRRGVECTGLVVGGGSRRSELVAQADRLGLCQVIEFAGEQDDVAPWLDRMDVFLMTSAAEPFGITALEAMARWVPVVAMPCPGGLSDLVAGGGMLLPDRTIGTAADAVAALLGSADLRRDLQARGNTAATEHTAERVFPMLQALYRQVVDGRRGAPRKAPTSGWAPPIS